jgi:PTS system nitrogen regulatory IIA component
LRGRDAAGVIQELSSALQREARVPDLLPFYHAALNREFLASTDMEAGMAFPHARVSGLEQLCFALGRSGESLVGRAGGVASVRLVFLLAVPATDATQYLLLIAGLARLSKDARLVDQLRSASDGVAMLEVLRQVHLPIPPKR